MLGNQLLHGGSSIYKNRIGTEKRINTSLTELNKRPGPGTYVEKSFIGNGPKVLMKSGRHNEEKDKDRIGPGPAAYNPNVAAVHRKSPTAGIGCGNRNTINVLIGKSNPGPGSYTLKEGNDGPKYRFGTSKRYKNV